MNWLPKNILFIYPIILYYIILYYIKEKVQDGINRAKQKDT